MECQGDRVMGCQGDGVIQVIRWQGGKVLTGWQDDCEVGRRWGGD